MECAGSASDSFSWSRLRLYFELPMDVQSYTQTGWFSFKDIWLVTMVFSRGFFELEPEILQACSVGHCATSSELVLFCFVLFLEK